MRIKCLHIFLSLSLLSILFQIYCDAPRYNPLDPKNPSSAFRSISGRVLTITTPANPIANVTVYWQNNDRMVFTDDNGYFNINDVLPQNGWLLLSRDGYLSDSVEVIWTDNQNVNVQILLNAKPHLDSLVIYSEIRNMWPDRKTPTVIIIAEITDTDNDIDSVYVVNSNLKIKQYLKYNVDDRLYEKTLSIYSLNVNSIEQAVGHDFEVKVVDRFSHIITVGSERVQRIIHDEVKFASPSSYDIVPATPQLQWQSFNPGFKFTFFIEIFTNEIISEKVWEMGAIPSDRTDLTVGRTLPSGDYFWVIWCVDEFYNRSRSKPASFTVE